ncbi:Hypothetical predicted protein [Olea europaea subsp. europaea]|uniref:Pentatricopeptide repeat-containing protein n=1 Tax=Olea europaea subsp. europaea TaxID=158383 RepID=A0A8S0RXD9_OLEEU|nr:Hypothetical predicted protein [Olea europaea subsp. europaea]
MGHMDITRRVFNGIEGKNVVSWNSTLAGYVKSRRFSNDSECIITLAMTQSVFDEMPEKDVISWNAMVSSYAMGRNMEQGYALFRQMPGSSFASWNAMIYRYLDCRKIELACSFFDAVPQKNNVSHINFRVLKILSRVW